MLICLIVTVHLTLAFFILFNRLPDGQTAFFFFKTKIHMSANMDILLIGSLLIHNYIKDSV